MAKGFASRVRGRRQSTNVEDQRGPYRQVRTTPKQDRLNPLGSKMIRGMNRIEKVNQYARRRRLGHQIDQLFKDFK